MAFTGKYDEATALILRRHPSALIKPYLKASIPAIVGIIILFNADGQLFSWIGLLIVFGSISYALFEYVIWYFDIVVITKSRLMDINQRTLFTREIKETSINRISNIVIKTAGLFASLFGYGTLIVSSSSGEIILEDLKNPHEIKNIIERLQEKNSLSANELIDFIIKAKQKLAR